MHHTDNIVEINAFQFDDKVSTPIRNVESIDEDSFMAELLNVVKELELLEEEKLFTENVFTEFISFVMLCIFGIWDIHILVWDISLYYLQRLYRKPISANYGHFT